jgi:hypothetical protein
MLWILAGAGLAVVTVGALIFRDHKLPKPGDEAMVEARNISVPGKVGLPPELTSMAAVQGNLGTFGITVTQSPDASGIVRGNAGGGFAIPVQFLASNIVRLRRNGKVIFGAL